MIRAFVFDIGNVLLRFDFENALEKIRARCATPVSLGAFDPVKAAYENGQLSTEEFQQRVIAILGYSGPLEHLVGAYEDIFTENEPMIRLVRRLHRHYPLYLLSNTSDLHVQFILRTYPFFSLFRDAVYSYRAKLSKPDPAIFDIAARQFAIEPSETVYIDDLEPNVAAARLHRFHAIHYDFRDHAALESALTDLGIQT